jgi:hypothetical protein
MSQTATAVEPWKQTVAEQLAQIGVPDDTSHLVVHRLDDGTSILLDLANSEAAGIVSAEDHSTKVDGGEVVVVPRDQIPTLAAAPPPADEPIDDDVEPLEPAAETEAIDLDTLDEEQQAEAIAAEGDQLLADGTARGEDPETGKLFEVPRVAIDVDDTDPTVLKITFGGSIELERGVHDDAAFFNRLKPGRNVSLEIEAFVSSPKTTHRRDSDGNVDAVVASKSLIVHSVDIA